MKMITFIGDPRTDPPGHGPDTINFFGSFFPKGRAVKCDNPELIAKAESHTHFTVEAPAVFTKKVKRHAPNRK